MPKVEVFRLPKGYHVWNDFKGRKYVLIESKTSRALIIAEFEQRPTLDRCLMEIAAWEELRANVRGDGK